MAVEMWYNTRMRSVDASMFGSCNEAERTLGDLHA